MKLTRRITPLLFALSLSASSALASNWDESVDGDISGDRLAPSQVTLTSLSQVTGTVIAGDLDYITVHATYGIQAIVLDSFVSTDDLAFIAIQAGSTFTEPPTGTVVGNLLGYAHMSLPTGQDLLPVMLSGPGAAGNNFPPGTNFLPVGDTLWIQQTGAQSVGYSLRFVPEPATWALFALGLGALVTRRRR